jgi:hypothetical protein
MLAAAAVVAISASSAFAGTIDVKVGDVLKFSDRPGTIGGGEFGADVVGVGSALDFVTFCVQRSEYLNFSNEFKVVGVTAKSEVDGISLSPKTAWLYSQFRAGTLTGYDGSAAMADKLQAAIWKYQNQAPYAATVNSFTLLADAENPVGIGNVRIANLVWNTAASGYPVGTPAQDVLVIIPLPPAAFAGLGLMGVVAVGQIRRRLGSTTTV